jgi:hypothetical protein
MKGWSHFVSFFPMFRGRSHKMARAMAVLQAVEPEQPAGVPDRVAVLAEKLDRMLATTLEHGEQVDMRVHGGVGETIVVTDRRAIVMRATPFRKQARVRSFPFHTIVFAEVRTNLNTQAGRLRIGVLGDVRAGPFAPVRPSWSSDEMKFVDFSLDQQGEMEQAAALITERAGAAKGAAPAPA